MCKNSAATSVRQNRTWHVLWQICVRPIGFHYSTSTATKGSLRLMKGEQARKDCQKRAQSLLVIVSSREEFILCVYFICLFRVCFVCLLDGWPASGRCPSGPIKWHHGIRPWHGWSESRIRPMRQRHTFRLVAVGSGSRGRSMDMPTRATNQIAANEQRENLSHQS